MEKSYVCKVCQKEKPASEYYYGESHARKKPRMLRHTKCKSCSTEYFREYQRKNPHVKILIRCKRDDKMRGHETNLTKEIVKELISKPCTYCEVTEVPIVLDRIDNSKGHVVGNVNPSCQVCNIIKRDMPFAAWQLLVPGMKEARRLGHFDCWVPANAQRTGNKFAQN